MSLTRIARNKHGDDVLKLFGPLVNRVCSEHWEVHAGQAQFERLIRGEQEDCLLNTYSLLKPSIFDGFKKVLVASACMQETMFYRLFLAQGVDLRPAGDSLTSSLRYAEHAHGERISINYACDEAWSKRFRDMLVEDEGSGQPIKLLDRVKRSVVGLLGTERFIWMGNKDLDDGFFGTGTAQRLPNTPHGLNTYQGFHNVVVVSALNPPPQHFHFMEGYSIDGDEVRTAHYRTAVYQAVMRCSIRNPQDMTAKRVVVMDRDTAEWLADLFPGATVEALPGMGVVPRKGKAGRRRKHESDAEKTSVYRKNKKQAWFAELDRLNGTSFAMGRYPCLGSASEIGEFRCDDNPLYIRDYVTASAPQSSTSGTAFATIYDAKPLDYIDHQDDDSFIAGLRDLHGRQVAKEDAGLISPAHFDPEKSAETSRGLDNILHVRGIWLDNDGGDLTPDAFADLFPYLRVVTWNTASSTPQKPRWRAFIPTSCAMSIEVHRLIMQQVEQVLEKAGYWGKRKLEKRKGTRPARCHGFDESKFNAASLFYLPCQAKDPEGSFFTDYGERDPRRGALDLHQWIERCILSLRPEPDPAPIGPVTAKPVLLPETQDAVSDQTISKLQAIRQKLAAAHAQSQAGRREEKVARAIEAWRPTPSGMGHHNFFLLGAALYRAGLDLHEVRAKLHEEVMFAHSPGKRRREIDSIVKKLGRSGTFGRKGA